MPEELEGIIEGVLSNAPERNKTKGVSTPESRVVERQPIASRSAEQIIVNAKKAVQKMEKQLTQNVERISGHAGNSISLTNSANLEVLHNREVMSDKDLLEILDVMQGLRVAVIELKQAQAAKDVPNEDIEKAERLLELYDAAHKEASSRFLASQETAVADVQPDMSSHVIAQYARTFHENAQIHITEGKGVAVERDDQGNVTIIIMPSHPTMDQFLQLARELAPDQFSAEGNVLANARQFSQDLMTAAFIMSQQGVFTEETIVMVYNAGYQLHEMLTNPNYQPTGETIIPIEVIQREAAQEYEKIDEVTARRVFFDVLLGRQEGATFSNGQPRRGENPQRSFYFRLKETWEKWKERSPHASLEEKESFETWAWNRKELLTNLLSRFVNTGIDSTGKVREGLQGLQREVVSSVEQKVFVHNINHLVHTVKQAVEGTTRDFAAIARQARERLGEKAPTEEQQLYILGAITAALQNPRDPLVRQVLSHMPAEARKFFTDEKLIGTDASCALKAAILWNVLQEQGFTNVRPHQEGTHMYIIATINNKYYETDPSTPEGQVAIREITDPARLAKLREEEQQLPNAENIIISAFLHNMVAVNLLQTKGLTPQEQQTLRVSTLQEAVKRNPQNVPAWVELAHVYGKGTDQYDTYMEQAAMVDKSLTDRLANTSSEERAIGNWNIDPALRTYLETHPNPDVRALLDAIDLQINELQRIQNEEYAFQQQLALQQGLQPPAAPPPVNLSRFAYFDRSESRLAPQQGRAYTPYMKEWADKLGNLRAVIDPAHLAELGLAFQQANQDAHRLEIEEHGAQYFRLSKLDEEAIRGNMVGWLEGRFSILTSFWKDGAMPAGPAFEAYTSKMQEATDFVNRLKDTGYFTEEEATEFIELQATVQQMMVAATHVELGGGGAHLDHYKQAQHALQEVQYAGFWLLGRFVGGSVGDLVHMYNYKLRRQFVQSGRWLTTNDRVTMRQELVSDVVRDAISRRNNNPIQQGQPVNYGNDLIGVYAQRYENIIRQVKDRRRLDPNYGNEHGHIRTDEAVAKEALKKSISSHLTMARWISIAELDEAAIAAKGFPPDQSSPYREDGTPNPKYDPNKNYPKADFAGMNFPWLTGIISAFRFDGIDTPNRRFFYGTTTEPGPWRKHIVDTYLTSIGFDPNSMSANDKMMADKAVFWYEYYYQSDRLVDSGWRISHGENGGYLFYLRKGLVDVYQHQHANATDAEAKEYAEQFGLGLMLRSITANAHEGAKKGREDRSRFWSDAISHYMPDKAFEAVREHFDKERWAGNTLTAAEVRFISFLNGNEPFLQDLEHMAINHHMVVWRNGVKEQVQPGDFAQLHQTINDPLVSDENKLRAQRQLATLRFDTFTQYVAPVMLQIRRDAYRQYPPIQPKFGEDGYGQAQLADYFNGLGFQGVQMAANFQNFMLGMTQEVGRRDENGISMSLGEDYRYLGYYFRAAWEEDALIEVQDPHGEHYHATYNGGFVAWLEGEAGNGPFRHLGDLINQTQGADVVMGKIVNGDMSNPEEILKASIEAAQFISNVRGSGGEANFALKYPGFYLVAIGLKHVFGALGIDARTEGASLAKEFFGVHIVGRTPQERLQLFEKFVKRIVQLTSASPEEAEAKEHEMRRLLGITEGDLKTLSIIQMLFLLFVFTARTAATNELPKIVMGK